METQRGVLYVSEDMIRGEAPSILYKNMPNKKEMYIKL